MKILAVTLALVVVVAVSAVLYLKYRLDNTPDNMELEAALDSEVKKLTRNDLSYGLVIGVYKDGKSLIKGYGTVNKESSTVPDASTVFQIASVSKLFTASLLQILCDKGVLKIDATLGELIGGSFSLSPAAQRVTLKQLVTHTSGFPSIPKSLGLKATELAGKENLMQNPYSHLGPQYLFDYLKTTKDKREPGRFEYSNFGMGLLGHVLEIVTKRNFEPLVSEMLLAPLDMRNTAVTLTPEMKEHLAQGYTADGVPSPMWTFSALAGAGAFNSNVEDMMKFIRANIEDGSLMSRTLKKMHAPQLGGDTGIGWIQPTFLDRFFGNSTVVWHNGMVGGYASYVSIDTKANTGIVILSNKAVDVTMLGMMLTRQARTQSWSSQHAF
ncbi:MAG: serine hydrolase domain-containing protein [Gammaproteobacteria bacterium]